MFFDLAHWRGLDISTNNTGDLLTCSGDLRTQQRIVRRLLTNPGGYIAQPNYGAGLMQFIGKAADVPTITALIRGQLTLEASVATNPIPVITVTQTPGNTSAFNVQINYFDLDLNKEDVLFLNVSKNSAP